MADQGNGGIDLIISATDVATSVFQGMEKSVAASIEKTMQAAQASSDGLTSAFNRLNTTVKTVVGGFIGFKAIKEAIGWISDAMEMSKQKATPAAEYIKKYGETVGKLYAALDDAKARIGGSIAQAISHALSGGAPIIDAMRDAITRFAVVISNVFIPALGQIFEGMHNVFGGAMPGLATVAGEATNHIHARFNQMAIGIATALAVIKTAVEEWKLLFEIAVNTIALSIEIWTNRIKNSFDFVRDYLKWFGAGMVSEAKAMLTNFGMQIAAFAIYVQEATKSAMDRMMGRTTAQQHWKEIEAARKKWDITSGIGSALGGGTWGQQPTMGGGKPTATEKALADTIAALTGQLGKIFGINVKALIDPIYAIFNGPAPGQFRKNAPGAGAGAGSGGDGANLLQSRFLTRGPGAESDVLAVQREQLAVQRQHLAAVALANVNVTRNTAEYARQMARLNAHFDKLGVQAP